MIWLFFLSFIIVALGQPAWSPWLAPVSACVGYALFWRFATTVPFSKRRFWLATLWFGGVQLIQLSWMTSIEFHGIYILLVYGTLAFWLGLQFGFVTLFVDRIPLVATAACWTLFEWARLYVLCGFSWNPLGLTLTAFAPSLQTASLFGILGLSFLVILTNLAVWKKKWIAAGVLAIFPYAFGVVQLAMHQSKVEKSSTMTVGLVQTGLLPSEKIIIERRLEEFIPPVEQWSRIFSLLKTCQEPLDLVVLPEFAVPYSAMQNVYPVAAASRVLEETVGDRPLLLEGKKRISNHDWMQMISKIFQTDVIAGLEAEDKGLHYSSAFYYSCRQESGKRYDKQILVPLAEYIPFEWVKILTAPYGITEFFTHGKKPKIFSSHHPIAASICYEETFSHFMRKSRLKGASMFVNLTNDNWYPHSRLAKQHFDHARVRTVENGVPLVRACNSGFTAAVDCLGKTVGQIAEEKQSGILVAHVPTYHFSTLYSLWGDWGIVILCVLFLALCFYTTRSFVKK